VITVKLREREREREIWIVHCIENIFPYINFVEDMNDKSISNKAEKNMFFFILQDIYLKSCLTNKI